MVKKEWTRPSSVPIPTVWRRFTGKKLLPNGQELRFRVQDFTEDMRPMIIQHMMDYFIYDEPTCRNQGLAEDEEAVKELRWFWDKYLGHGVALVAFVDNLDELEDKSLPPLAGINITAVATPSPYKHQYKSPITRRVLGIVDECSELVDCFEKYQVSEYLYALGLSVHPAYRGQGVGLEILRARFDIGKAVGLKLTVSVFTAGASQKIAEQAGLETIATIDYKDFKDDEGNAPYHGMDVKSVALMVARIQ